MTKSTKLALFGHGKCGSKFFTYLNDDKMFQYKGTCPNPSCNHYVELLPEELYTSTDKARRDYIKKKSNGRRDDIFWHM
jgi:hypothetical protein